MCVVDWRPVWHASSRCCRTGQRSGAGRGGRWRDHRQVIDAIAFEYRTGTPWMDLPEHFGSGNGRGRHAAAGDALRDPVAKFRGAVLDVDQVEPAEYRVVLGDEHVESADAGLLLSQQGVVPVGELVEEVVAAVGDRGSEVGAVRRLKGPWRPARPPPDAARFRLVRVAVPVAALVRPSVPTVRWSVRSRRSPRPMPEGEVARRPTDVRPSPSAASGTTPGARRRP